MKVLILAKYTSQGASTRLRTLQYLNTLHNNNIETTVSSLFNDRYLDILYQTNKKPKIYALVLILKRVIALFSVQKYDILWIEKELFPYFPSWFEYSLSMLGVKYIVDYDDAVFHNYDRSSNSIVRLFLKRKISKVMRMSSGVIVGNNYLKEYAELAKADNILLLPTVITLEKYTIVKSNIESRSLNIGWIGTPQTQKYLEYVLPVLNDLYKKHDIKLTVIGGNNIPNSKLPVDYIVWNEATEVDNLSKFDIGIMPLPNQPFEKGKCGYKLIQYMALCIPVIGSPVGANKNIINESNSGYLACDLNEWSCNLEKLILNADLRSTLGKNGRLAVENNYCTSRQADKLVKYIKATAQF